VFKMGAAMDQLFSRATTSEFFYRLKQKLDAAITGLEPHDFSASSDEQILTDLLLRHGVQAVTLHRDQEHIDGPVQVQIDVSRNFNYVPTFDGRPSLVSGVRFTLIVPFSGSAHLLDLRPSTFTANFPQATIAGKTLQFVVEEAQPDATSIQQRFKGLVASVEQWLGYVNADVINEMAGWHQEAVVRIATQRARLSTYDQVGDDLRRGLRA